LASPKRAAPVPEAAIPARNTTSPPGKISPINNPVSIKMMPSTPIKPRFDTTEWASRRVVRFIVGLGYLVSEAKLSVINLWNTYLFASVSGSMCNLST
jgi:hypothetical protein